MAVIKNRVTQSTIAEDDDASSRELAIKHKFSLHGADLYGAYLYTAGLREANLREADLRKANLREADLCRADLRGANLYEADLREADLRGADLRGANLRGADLYRADLRGANLWDLGQDQRGYRFFLFFDKETKKFTIKAGCRSFTLAGAWEHWRERHSDAPLLQVEILARLTMAEAIAAQVLKETE